MERWTKRTADGVLLSEDREEKYTPIELIDILLERLAAYEDTGLEPEYIRELLADAHAMHDELKRYKEAEKNEPLTLEELLSMIGEPVWVVSNFETARDGCWELMGESLLILYEDYTFYRHKPQEVTQ